MVCVAKANFPSKNGTQLDQHLNPILFVVVVVVEGQQCNPSESADQRTPKCDNRSDRAFAPCADTPLPCFSFSSNQHCHEVTCNSELGEQVQCACTTLTTWISTCVCTKDVEPPEHIH